MDIESHLDDLSEPMEARLAVCREALRDPHLPIRGLAKCATWLAYRAIEAGTPDEAREPLWRAIGGIRLRESHEFWRARWLGSLMMALAYVRVAGGGCVRGPLRLGRDFGWLALNPSGAVNFCRSQVLLAALEAREGRFHHAEEAIDAARQGFDFAAQRWPLRGAYNCNGHELVLMARAMHVAIALLPHARMPYQGEVFGREMILGIDTTEPFRSALAAVLPAIPDFKSDMAENLA